MGRGKATESPHYYSLDYGERHVGAAELIRLMHFARPGGPARALAELAPGVYDWEGRPERPVHPGTWVLRYGFDREDVTPAQAAHDAARDAYAEYGRLWPALPKKTVRRLLNRGWVAQDGPRITVTPLGRHEWFVARYGRGEATPPGRRLSYNGAGRRKHKPAPARRLYSDYRWRQLGYGRRNHSSGKGTPMHVQGGTQAAWRRPGYVAPEEPAPAPRREWRRRGWLERVSSRVPAADGTVHDERTTDGRSD